MENVQWLTYKSLILLPILSSILLCFSIWFFVPYIILGYKYVALTAKKLATIKLFAWYYDMMKQRCRKFQQLEEVFVDDAREQKSEETIVVKKKKKKKKARVSKFEVGELLKGQKSIYKGTLDGRLILVKKVEKEFELVVQNEMKMLIEVDQHPHLIRYFTKEEHEKFTYLALEYCPLKLEDVVKNKNATTKHLYQLASAIEHIHSLNIVHMNINPENVLIGVGDTVKLSDFSSSVKLDDKMEKTVKFPVRNSKGWVCPELLQKNGKITKAVDVFAFGCVIYYVLTAGGHPFGIDENEREKNVISGKYNLSGLDPLSRHLVQSMLKTKAAKRLAIQDILKHPFFWDDNRKISFICDISSQLSDPESTIYKRLCSQSGVIFNGSWDSYIDKSIIENVSSFRNYDYKSAPCLVRFIRNMKNHYNEYDQRVHKWIPTADGIYKYFSTKFPMLFCTLYTIAEQIFKDNTFFRKYFD